MSAQSGSDRAFPLQPVLRGKLVELRPLEPEDWTDLYGVASDPLVWEQHPVKDRYKREVFKPFFGDALLSGGAFTVRDLNTNRIIGSTRFANLDAGRGEIEIGWTFLARAYWGGLYNGEMKALMIAHALEYVESVVFVIGPDNIRSQKAVEKIGGRRIEDRKDAKGQTRVVYEVRRDTYQKNSQNPA